MEWYYYFIMVDCLLKQIKEQCEEEIAILEINEELDFNDDELNDIDRILNSLLV